MTRPEVVHCFSANALDLMSSRFARCWLKSMRDQSLAGSSYFRLLICLQLVTYAASYQSPRAGANVRRSTNELAFNISLYKGDFLFWRAQQSVSLSLSLSLCSAPAVYIKIRSPEMMPLAVADKSGPVNRSNQIKRQFNTYATKLTHTKDPQIQFTSIHFTSLKRSPADLYSRGQFKIYCSQFITCARPPARSLARSLLV